MKKIAFIIALISFALVSCGKTEQTTNVEVKEPTAWEYKIVKLTNKDEATQHATINTLSLEGWELANTYTEIGTSINRSSGSNEYINVHTKSINYIFKRPLSGSNVAVPVE